MRSSIDTGIMVDLIIAVYSQKKSLYTKEKFANIPRIKFVKKEIKRVLYRQGVASSSIYKR